MRYHQRGVTSNFQTAREATMVCWAAADSIIGLFDAALACMPACRIGMGSGVKFGGIRPFSA